MYSAVGSMFDPPPAERRRLNRVITWSVAIHVGIVAFILFTPRSWWTDEPEAREVMRINLGGSPGPETGGRTNIGGRTVEQVAPTPPRPETARPTPPAPPPPTPAPATRTPPRTPPSASAAPPRPAPPASTAKPQQAAPQTASRPPVTGSQITKGNTQVDTGASGQGAGLASGGRFGGGETDLANFCCPDYLNSILTMIDSRWNKNHPERGETTIKFTIGRDGTISNIVVERSSGYGTLDRAARAALLDARVLPRLPDGYTRETLTVHLKFPYGQ
jgi:TonB family protein